MAQARTWAVGPGETGEVDQQELQEAMLDCASVVRRLGGAIQIVPHRVQAEGGGFYTVGVVFEWLSRTDTRPRPEEPDVAAEPLAEALADHELDQPAAVPAAAAV